MKRTFTLFSTLILVFIFSILALKIYEINSTNSKNVISQYKYIQAKNHLDFLEKYIKSLENLELLNKIQIKEEKFNIVAFIQRVEDKEFEIELSVKAIGFNVRVYKKIVLKKL